MELLNYKVYNIIPPPPPSPLPLEGEEDTQLTIEQ